jgi:hypothetical protein
MAYTEGNITMAVDFAKLLSKPLDDVKKPPAWPAGTYLGNISRFEFGDNNANKTPYTRLFIKVNAAGPGLEESELAGIDVTKGREFRRDFYLLTKEGEDLSWRLKELMESCGLSCAGRTVAEVVPELVGCAVQVEIVQQNSTRNAEELVNFAGEVKGIS